MRKKGKGLTCKVLTVKHILLLITALTIGDVWSICVPIFEFKAGCKKKKDYTACHLGKLKLAFTSPNVFSTSPKSFLKGRIDFTALLLKTSFARRAS